MINTKNLLLKLQLYGEWFCELKCKEMYTDSIVYESMMKGTYYLKIAQWLSAIFWDYQHEETNNNTSYDLIEQEYKVLLIYSPNL